MNDLPPPRPIEEIARVDFAQFHGEIRAAGRPVVMRGLAAAWPGVAAAHEGDRAMADYLLAFGPRMPIGAMFAPPEVQGRFHYNAELTGFNFIRQKGQLADFLADLIDQSANPAPPAMAVQSEKLADLLPGFAEANPMPLLADVPPRIWLGNRIHVAPHFDLMENIGVCLAGRRRFTLFPPEQLPNLYPGPLDVTPAGVPVSLVDLRAPDLALYPRFAEAAATAQAAVLEPGDALYIPFAWWHGVDALEPVSILVNYWWRDGRAASGADPTDALLHAVLALRHVPADQRRAWQNMFAYYVFANAGDPVAHLPDHLKGMMGAPSPGLFAHIREVLKRKLV